MYRGKSELSWQPISVLCSLIANIVRDRKKHPKPFTPEHFNPWQCESAPPVITDKIPITKDTISMLKVFVPRKPDVA